MKKAVASVFAVFLLSLGAQVLDAEAPAAPAADAHVSHQTARVTVCTAVENREPVDAVTETGTSAGRVICWMKMESESVPTTVKHVWYAGDEKVGEVSLKVPSSPYRTWSSKNVWPGMWRVEVVSESGAVLDRKEFKVN